MISDERNKQARSSVNTISVDQGVFELMVSAISRLSLKTKRFESLGSVVSTAISEYDHVPPPYVQMLPEPNTFGGSIKVHFRLRESYRPSMARMKAHLADAGRSDCTLRDLIVVCCLLTLNDKA